MKNKYQTPEIVLSMLVEEDVLDASFGGIDLDFETGGKAPGSWVGGND